MINIIDYINKFKSQEYILIVNDVKKDKSKFNINAIIYDGEIIRNVENTFTIYGPRTRAILSMMSGLERDCDLNLIGKELVYKTNNPEKLKMNSFFDAVIDHIKNN